MTRVPYIKAALLVLALAVVTACGTMLREDIATRLAHAAWMVKRDIPAAPFALRAYERMHERHAPANIYIEGDGLAWTHMGDDPTPENPVALHLATKDKADNVAYLARPCQYAGKLDGTPCEPEYWTERRYAPEVIRAYGAALDNIRAHYDIKGFNLIGYDGGAVIAAELAKKRKDVLSVRTVAGKLREISDPAALTNMPQHHFIGGQDKIVTPAHLHTYLQEAKPSNCLNYSFIQENTHEEGWPAKWPELLKEPVNCSAPRRAVMPDYEPYESGVYTTRETPEKP